MQWMPPAQQDIEPGLVPGDKRFVRTFGSEEMADACPSET